MGWFSNLFKKKVVAPVIITPCQPPVILVPDNTTSTVIIPQPNTTTLPLPINGIDVYHGDIINWDELSPDIKFIFIKASEGETVTDDKFNEYREKAHAKGILVGAYHFYRTNKDPLKQAKEFMSQLKELRVGELPPVLDWETDDAKDKPHLEEIKLFLDYVEGRCGITPIIYSGSSFIGDQRLPPSFKRYPLWVAQYSKSGKAPTIPLPWKAYTFYQMTDSQTVKGLKKICDYNVFNGSMDDLKALCKK